MHLHVHQTNSHVCAGNSTDDMTDETAHIEAAVDGASNQVTLVQGIVGEHCICYHTCDSVSMPT